MSSLLFVMKEYKIKVYINHYFAAIENPGFTMNIEEYNEKDRRKSDNADTYNGQICAISNCRGGYSRYSNAMTASSKNGSAIAQ